MGLGIRLEQGRFYPVLICDTCGAPITDWHQGLAAHDLRMDEGIRPINVFHKGDCDPERAGRRSEEASGWQGLRMYLSWLLWNNGWGRKYQEPPQGRKLLIDVPEPLDLG